MTIPILWAHAESYTVQEQVKHESQRVATECRVKQDLKLNIHPNTHYTLNLSATGRAKETDTSQTDRQRDTQTQDDGHTDTFRLTDRQTDTLFTQKEIKDR